MLNKKIVGIVAVVLLCLITTVAGSNITTYTEEDVGTCSVKFTGNLTNMSGESYVICYFEYGLNSGGFMFKTSDQNLTSIGNFTESVKSPIFFGEKIYKYRAVGDFDGEMEYGDEVNFTMLKVDKVEVKDFSKYYDKFDFTDMTLLNFVIPILWVWTDAWGGFFWVILFGLPFLLMFIAQVNTTIPGLIALSVGAGLFKYLPPEWRSVAYALLVVSFAGIMIGLLKSSRR